jgi:hypothetical protein
MQKHVRTILITDDVTHDQPVAGSESVEGYTWLELEQSSYREHLLLTQ